MLFLTVLMMLAGVPVVKDHIAQNNKQVAAVKPAETPKPADVEPAAGDAAGAPVEAVTKEALTSDNGDFQYEETAPPPSLESARLNAPHDGKPKIAIIIDDMGVDLKHSARAMTNLPAAVTLSFLPYSPKITEQTSKAYDIGHELLVHMPMEAVRGTVDPGPDALRTGLSDQEIALRTEKNLNAFSGYVGVNNHMGSKFSQDSHGLGIVMDHLAPRHLFFVDSVTIASSVAESVAKEHHLQATHRDVFIDHFETPDMVQQALKRIEYVAKHEGTAIAIGHPKDVTLDALEKWLPTLKEKGIELVPLSAIVDQRAGAALPPASVATLEQKAPVASPSEKEAAAAAAAIEPAAGTGVPATEASGKVASLHYNN